MEDFSTWVVIVGGLLLGLFMTLAAIQEKFPKLKEIRPLNLFSESLIVLFLLCIPVFVISALIQSSNAPSGYENCMQGIESATDPQAISYMEDYCYEQNPG